MNNYDNKYKGSKNERHLNCGVRTEFNNDVPKNFGLDEAKDKRREPNNDNVGEQILNNGKKRENALLWK